MSEMKKTSHPKTSRHKTSYRKKRPEPEYSKRAYDGKTRRWEWKYETELGVYPKDWARRFPHLADRGRWVITEVK